MWSRCPRAPQSPPARSPRRRPHRPTLQWRAAAAVAAAVLALSAAATSPRGVDGAFSVRPFPARDADGGGAPTPATATPSGSSPRELPSAVALDASGAVFVAGTTRVAASTAAGGSSGVFLLKASPLGDVLWRTDVVSSGGLDALGGLVVAPSGVYLAVTTNGRFDGSAAGVGSGGSGGRVVAATAAAGDGESFYDGALLCFSADAPVAPRWTYQNGTAAADAYTAVAVRPEGGGDKEGRGGGGSLVVAGWTQGAQFGAAAGRRDVVVLELNVTGAGGGGGVVGPTVVNGVQWGTAADELASAVAIAADGTVYVAVQQTLGAAADGDGTADAAAAGGDGVTRDRLMVYALDGRLARRLAADGTVAPAMEVLAQSSFVVGSMAAGAAGRVYAAGVASVADGRRDDALLALFNLTSSASSSAGGAAAAAAAATPVHKAVVVWNESAPTASERAVSVMVERGGNVVLVGHVRDPASGAVAPWVMVYDPLGRLVYGDGAGSAGGGAAMEPRSCALDIARASFFCVGLLHGQAGGGDAGAAAFGRYDWTVVLPSAGVTTAGVGAGSGGAVTGNGLTGDGGSTGGGDGGTGDPSSGGGDGGSGLDGFLSKRLNVVLLLAGAVVAGLLLGGAAVGTLLTLGRRRRDADQAMAESYFADDLASPKGSGGSGSAGAASSSSASVVPGGGGSGGGTAWHGSAAGSSSPHLPALPTLFASADAASSIGGGVSRAASARTLPRPPSTIDQQLSGSASFFSASGAVPGGGGGGGRGRGGLSRIDSELSVGSRSFFKN